ncbi:MAG: radical SAM protein [Kiritimatiellia bacterium]
MHVVLIQPPDGVPAASSLRLSRRTPSTLAPDWDILCLQAYLKAHSRHLSTIVDCRLFADLELEFEHAVDAVAGPKAIAVNTTGSNLGETAAVLEISKRRWPEIRTIIFGRFPSQFPEHIEAVARADYAISGDPEPVLRSLLDYIDSDKRLQFIPGLNFAGKETSTAWLPDLNNLSLPDWGRVFWRAYHHPDQPGRQPAHMRLSRGHTREACDRAWGAASEPLRLWPIDKLAQSVRASADLGVTEIFLDDPPGVWNPGRLREWCQALARIYNKQNWGLQMVPCEMEQGLIGELQAARCRRIDFIVPTCDKDLQEKFGISFKPRNFRKTVAALERSGFEVFLRLWAGGPEEKKGGVRHAVRLIHHLPAAHVVLEPFPFFMDSPLYQSVSAESDAPRMEDWLRWMHDPWTLERPAGAWPARGGVRTLQKQMASIQRQALRSPKWQARRLLHFMKSSYPARTASHWAEWIFARIPHRA